MKGDLTELSEKLEAFNQMDVDGLVMILGQFAACGAAALVVLLVWRKCAAAWSVWSGGTRKAMQLTLMGALGALAYYAMQLQGASQADPLMAGMAAMAGGIVAFPVARMLGLTFVKPAVRVDKGAVLASPAEVARRVKRDGPARLALGGVPVPRKSEPVHFLMQGGTGSGKSVAINHLLGPAYRDGDIILVIDSGGDFASRYYDAKRDRILNPFDARSVAWNPMAEMRSPYDAEELAKSIIPPGTGDGKEWNSYAQTFLASCLTVLHRQGEQSMRALMYLVQDAPMEELAKTLAGTAAAAQLTSDKTFGSIRVIATNYMTAYAYLPNPEPGAPAFSVREFIERGRPGALFVTYRDDQLATLQNLMACVLDVASRTVLSLEPNDKRRVWLVVDEFASIGKVQSIESFAAKARKYGGCLVIGIQSVSQLFDKYGEQSARALLSNLGSWLVLRCSDADTAEYMSRYLGDQQITRHTESSSQGKRGSDSRSMNEQVTVQRVVMGAELQELAPLNGYLRVAGGFPVCRVKLGVKGLRKATVSGFKERGYEAPRVEEAVPVHATSAPAPVPAAPAVATIPPSVEAAPAARATEARAPGEPTPEELLELLAGEGGATDQFLLDLLTGGDSAADSEP